MKKQVIEILREHRKALAKELRAEERKPYGDGDHLNQLMLPAVIELIDTIIVQVKAIKEKP